MPSARRSVRRKAGWTRRWTHPHMAWADGTRRVPATSPAACGFPTRGEVPAYWQPVAHQLNCQIQGAQADHGRDAALPLGD